MVLRSICRNILSPSSRAGVTVRHRPAGLLLSRLLAYFFTALYSAVLVLKAGPFEMGILGAIQLVPYLLFGLYTGVWVDRVRRRPLLIAADLGRAILLGSIPVAVLLGSLSLAQLYAVGFLVGGLNVLFGVAYQAFLPFLIGRHHLPEANNKLSASASLSRIVGRGLGGTLVQLVTAPFAVAIDALSYVVSATLLLLMKVPESIPQTSIEHASTWSAMSHGLRTVALEPVLRTITLCWVVYEITAGMWGASYLLYIVHDLAIRPAVLGWVFSAGGVAGFAGAVLAGHASRLLGLGRSIWVSFLIVFCGGIFLVLAQLIEVASIELFLVSNILSAVGLTVAGISQSTLRQGVTPDGLQGRVSATFAFLTTGVQPIGLLLGGVLGNTFGVSAVIRLGVVGVLLTVVVILLSPVRSFQVRP
jgi:MFS family permease